MAALDDNTILDGLLSIGSRLYESEYECEIEPGSLAEAEELLRVMGDDPPEDSLQWVEMQVHWAMEAVSCVAQELL